MFLFRVRSSNRFVRIWLLPLLGMWLCSFGAGRVEARDVRAVRIEQPPRIDGRLNDAAWKRTPQIRQLIGVEPVEGGEPSERTEIWVLFDSKTLYIGFRMHDRDPGALIANQLIEDQDMTSDDRINLLLDPFLDHRNGVFFQINPVGTRSDGLVQNNSTFRREWNVIWQGEASVDSGGWSAEIAIPFQSLSFDPKSTTWGLEIERQIRRRNEKARWANPSRNRSIIEVAGIGTLSGLVGIDATGVDLVPSFSGAYRRDRVQHDDDRRGRPGLDVFYRPTSSVTTGLTLNTDFSDAPVDDRQTNLTRFALFFPETRDFFLQDAGIFEFGGLAANGEPFFSRRVGLIGGRVVNLDAGLKLTGRIHDLNFGLLQVRTARELGYGVADLTAGRVQLNVLDESQVGLIFTNGDPRDEIRNQVFGADFRYRNSAFRGSNILAADFWAQQSRSSRVHSKQSALGTRISYPNDHVNFSLGYSEIQENFNPALGFVNRSGVRRYEETFRYRIRPKGWLRTIDAGLDGTLVTRRNDALDSSEWVFRLLEIANQAGDTFKLNYRLREEQPQASFLLDADSIILSGDYHFGRYQIAFETSSARLVKGKLELTWGDFYDGVLRRTVATLELRPLAQIFLAIELDQSDARLPRHTVVSGATSTRYPGDFTARLLRVRLNLGFTPTLSWTNLIQYDNSSDTIGFNSRLRWEIESGNELFLVLNHEFATSHHHAAPTTTQVTAKLAWTLRY